MQPVTNEDLTRRGFIKTIGAMGAAAAVTFPVVNVAMAATDAADVKDVGEATGEEAERDESHVGLYGGVSSDVEVKKIDATKEELFQMLLDEPEVTEDLTLPDGTVIDKEYVRLRNRLNRMSEGIAGEPQENSFEHIVDLWSVEDAHYWNDMPMLQWFTDLDFAAIEGITEQEAHDIIQPMADRMVVYRESRAGINWYFIFPWIYGTWECYDSKMDEEFVSMGLEGTDTASGSQYPVLIACPVSADVIDDGVIAPYRDWRAVFERNTIFAVGECTCRKVARLRGQTEDEEPVHCMAFGEMAQYYGEVGRGRSCTKEEAIQIAEDAVAAGFVPELYYSENPDSMCLCKCDCCDCLTAYRRVDGKTEMFPRVSAYTLVYDQDACIQCGACVDRCPMKAVSMDDANHPVIDTACIGCGQCALTCPASARKLHIKDEVAELPVNRLEDYVWRSEDRMSKGRIKDFVGTSLDNNEAPNEVAKQIAEM